MNNKKITSASHGKKKVYCKDLRRHFWASTSKAEVTGTMPLRFKRNLILNLEFHAERGQKKDI